MSSHFFIELINQYITWLRVGGACASNDLVDFNNEEKVNPDGVYMTAVYLTKTF